MTPMDIGGARPATPEEQARVPSLDHRIVTAMQAAVPAVVSAADRIALYGANYFDEDQSTSGCCTACSWDVAQHAVALFVQGQAIPQLSFGFGYYSSSNDATFGRGDSVSNAAYNRSVKGTCLDTLYPGQFVITHIRGLQDFDPEWLPKPECYADALQRKVLRFAQVAWAQPEMALVDSLLDAGYPIPFAIGIHAMCLIARAGDTYFAKDSKRPNWDVEGFGPGIHSYSRQQIATQAYDLLVCQETQLTGAAIVPPPAPPPAPAPPTGNAMTVANIKSLALALTDNPTQAQKDAGVAEYQKLVIAPPAPAPGVTLMPPATSLVDAAGYTWTQGEYIEPRYGNYFLVNGRALGSTKQLALVNGKVRIQNAVNGAWFEFSGDPYNPVWAPCPAP